MDIDEFSKRLKDCMIAKGFSCNGMARALGVSPVHVFNWTHAKNFPQLYYFDKLCDILEVSADYLMGRKGDG